MAGIFGKPSSFCSGCLPTKASIYNLYLTMREEGVESGKWPHNIAISEVVKTVSERVKDQWDKTEITSLFFTEPLKAERKVLEVVMKMKTLLKTPVDRRKKDFEIKLNEFSGLLDLAACDHTTVSSCSCPPSRKVPEAWRSFLQDQRGPRLQCSLLNRLRLRPGTVPALPVSPEETLAREQEKKRKERKDLELEREKKARDKSNQQKDKMKRKIEFESDEDAADIKSDSASESEWEDEKDVKKTPEYNTLKLKNFAREVDRYKVSNRAAAKIGNGLLKDLKIVTRNNTSKLLCPGKVRREREKYGKELDKDHRSKQPPAGLYCDGKKCPTLTRETDSLQVQVRGRR